MSSPRFQLVADVRAQIHPLYPDKVCIGPDGDLWMIAHDRPPSNTEHADPDSPEPAEVTILNFDGAVLRSVIPVARPHRDRRVFRSVQPLGANEVLLVESSAGEPNARVLDSKGTTVREFMLGCHINDVQTTRAGEIWVSYYEDGTGFGCWPVQEPPSYPAGYFEPGDGSNNEHFGLLRTTDHGEVNWRSSEPIFDCDGLNVFGDGSSAWVSYSLFPGTSQSSPIVRLDRDGARRIWHLDGGAYRGLAVNGETIALGGGWGDDRGSFLLGRLGEGDALEDLRDLGIRDETPETSRVIGRGPVMHWIQGTRWSVLDLRASP